MPYLSGIRSQCQVHLRKIKITRKLLKFCISFIFKAKQSKYKSFFSHASSSLELQVSFSFDQTFLFLLSFFLFLISSRCKCLMFLSFAFFIYSFMFFSVFLYFAASCSSSLNFLLRPSFMVSSASPNLL